MIYDRYSVAGNCRGCGINTHHHINGYFALCQECARVLLIDIADMMEGKEWERVSNYVDAFKKATVIGDVEES